MQRTVTVTGHGFAPAVPDSAVVTVVGVRRAPTVAEAVAGVDAAVSGIVAVARGFVTGAGGREADVASAGLQVWATTGPDGAPDGFEASHRLRIRCPNLPSASALVVGLAAEVGDALRIEAVALEVTDPGPAATAARESAYADARKRAAHLAGLAGAELGDVLVLEDGLAGSPGIARMDQASAGLEPGESMLDAAVTVTWQLL
ncbi:SIMPL domain-containing protein [Nocardioides houyundeii]|uniref:SIMPL domain-containing protein n=1 Tax=Nocardioides houyundeii TaxID=2045452 RepID=UPI000C760926|nr:SIMPL domain-containing protein [Nocardioides houyundeii]